MPSGVGAHAKRVRAVIAGLVVIAGVCVFASQARAQAVPPGIDVDKVEIGGVAVATFVVTGVNVDFQSVLTANVVAQNTPTPALPSPSELAPGTYQIQEITPAGVNAQQGWQLTSVVCDSQPMAVTNNSVQVVVTDGVILCSFTDTLTTLGRPELPEQAPTTTVAGGSTTTTTVAGGSTTTTTLASTTTTVVVVQTLPVIPETPPTTASPSSAPTTAPSLPTTGSPTGGLVVAALVAMLAGVALVARTRRFVE